MKLGYKARGGSGYNNVRRGKATFLKGQRKMGALPQERVYIKDVQGNQAHRLYKLGDSWREDFDYDGMLKYGAKIKVSDGITKMKQLFNSMEDVNYHTESSPLWDAIKALEVGEDKATKLLKTFNGVCKKALKA